MAFRSTAQSRAPPLTGPLVDGGVLPTRTISIDDPLELRLITAFRAAPMRARAPLVEITEQLAAARTGRMR